MSGELRALRPCCACPGPQVTGTKPTDNAREVREWPLSPKNERFPTNVCPLITYLLHLPRHVFRWIVNCGVCIRGFRTRAYWLCFQTEIADTLVSGQALAGVRL